ncbi:HNH endonuclease [Agrobacterium fabrum]|uniref:HNH endonuclease n=1 Tax=Agrobacterium fabrum TaxID=1176649 RepID=A0A7Z7BGI8_9HYPH|nr:HNH endonuclease [Agrobacterium fabrum]
MSYSSERRPAIPTELRRKVLVEAGHRCAIPTCRYIDVEIHHIVPYSSCQSHEYDNLIALCPNCHSRADSGVIDRKALRLYKFNLRFAHERFSQIEMDLLFELYKAPVGAAHPWQPFMLIFFKRIIDAGYVRLSVGAHPEQRGVSTHASFNGVDTSPTFILLSDKGRLYLEELGVQELEAPS